MCVVCGSFMKRFHCLTTAGGTVVYFNRREYSVSEDGGSVTLTVRTNVPGGPPNGSVTFFTEDGSANGESIQCMCSWCIHTSKGVSIYTNWYGD